MIDHTGLRIGLFAGLAGQYIQSANASIREEADRMNRQKMVQAEKPSRPVVTLTEALGRLARATRSKLHQLLRLLGPGFLSGMAGNDATAMTTYAIDGARAGYGHLWLMLLATPMYHSAGAG